MDCVKTIDSHVITIIERLEHMKKEEEATPTCVLILNKVKQYYQVRYKLFVQVDLYEKISARQQVPLLDRVEKKIPIVRNVFDDIISISALTGQNVPELLVTLIIYFLNNCRHF